MSNFPLPLLSFSRLSLNSMLIMLLFNSPVHFMHTQSATGRCNQPCSTERWVIFPYHCPFLGFLTFLFQDRLHSYIGKRQSEHCKSKCRTSTHLVVCANLSYARKCRPRFVLRLKAQDTSWGNMVDPSNLSRDWMDGRFVLRLEA